MLLKLLLPLQYNFYFWKISSSVTQLVVSALNCTVAGIRQSTQQIFLPPWCLCTFWVCCISVNKDFVSFSTLPVSPQGGILPTTHRRPRLHRGGLCGQRSTDWFLCPHWQELCHSEWNKITHTHNQAERGHEQQQCLFLPVVKQSHGSHIQMQQTAGRLLWADTDLV